MPLIVSSTHKSSLVIDGELIPIRIKRLAPTEAVTFNRDFTRLGRIATGVAPPTAEGADLSKDEQLEVDAKAFVVAALSAYVSIEAGAILDEDSQQSVTSGADFVRLFGARDEVLSEALMLIYMENKLNADQKAKWRQSLAPFVATPPAVASRMMELAEVTAADTLVDLGCGAGALCIAAAQRGATVVGYDSDPARIREAITAAAAAGVTERCTWVQQDASAADLQRATVVALYLLPASNLKLRPKLRALPAGTRVISHAFTFGTDWLPVQSDAVPLGEGEELAHNGQRTVHLYLVPEQAA